MTAELQQAGWYQEGWLNRVLEQAEEKFDRACDRWRDLYRAAQRQREMQNKIIGDVTRSQKDKEQARRLRAEAESQMELLTSGDELAQSDFYSYRYFASEGYLPGYSFPRLPLSAYIAGRRQGKNERDEYLSRPRFLAISEFGPRSIIYHEGSRYLVNRVILPVEAQGERGLITLQAKLCPHCGHLHPIVEGDYNPDRCEQCDQLLIHPLTSLMRMQNVSTKRRDRINSDEEERMRLGYEVVTSVRFKRGDHATATRTATVSGRDGEPLLRLTYSHAATIWRINLGWRRRRDKDVYGFVLDAERGYWAANKDAVEDDPEDPMSASKQRIVPFVEDRRNCLLVEPVAPLSLEQMASLQPALKNAIQVLYQLEDNELAAEPLPDVNQRRLILIYEAAEGGAGVLRQLLDQPEAIANVAREALRLCHYDSETGDDLRHAPNSREDCEAACYDCLMSYTNQLDHRLLDRTRIFDLLRALADATVSASPVAASRADHLDRLKALCDSDLERTWLDFLEDHNFRLPDSAQHLIEACSTRPDFLYTEQAVAIYIDGPHHAFSDIAAEDRRITTCLEDAGYMVIRFGAPASWPEVAHRHAWLFGEGER
jgi:very-short-patch-repair endonuclease